ncbi:DUF3422 domain-containing protein [Gimibacter soli]|uniref:DUF3422 domain-containing protein n=1 Tax=Gimibacter soli TaxID=3024400 RepID=A0AAE9XQP8_9PROT|nr:DUF3422 domain-containing protein [Gimibacter soli]WCL55538.1 DUF3422 domain-containing protein [Gimibacter soli]
MGDLVDSVDLLSLNAEWHARPGMQLAKGCRVVHIVTPRGRRILEGIGIPPDAGFTAAEARHHIAATPAFSVKWEGHTEVSNYTFAVPAEADQAAFTAPALGFLPATAAEAVLAARQLGVRVDFVAAGADVEAGGYHAARQQFGEVPLYGGLMTDGNAAVWADFRPDAEGFLRFLVIDISLTEPRMSRLAQRLLDIETYRFLAAAALPVARRTMERLDALEPQLDRLMADLRSRAGNELEPLLRQITHLAAEGEELVSSTAYRFAAARAYEDIVARRLADVREEVVPGYQRITTFLNKSFRPAMRTCEAAAVRADGFTGRVSRAVNLLNTMVDMEQKRQNQAILQSMEKQAATQVRLQQAVEGFSVFAIAYYAVSLFGYMLKALKGMGLPVPVEAATGVIVPVAIVFTALSVRHIKRRMHGE